MISCNVRHQKKNSAKGTTYQVRYPSKVTKSGYAYETFGTLKGARAFHEDSKAPKSARPRSAEITTVNQGIQRWLDVIWFGNLERMREFEPPDPPTLATSSCKTRYPSLNQPQESLVACPRNHIERSSPIFVGSQSLLRARAPFALT
jgi:hypothetical protein